MASQEKREREAPSEQEPREVPPSEESLLVEEKVNQLDQIVSDFQNKQISELKIYNRVVKFWDEVNQNPILKPMIEVQIRELRLQLHQLAPLDISKHGDPVRRRYDPREWIGRIPPEFEKKEEVFVLDRIRSLRDLFLGLRPKKPTPQPQSED
jgi:hypothetical protein